MYEVTLAETGDDTLETATISEWMVDEGDTVEEGDDLVEITTDKAAFTVACPVAGTIRELCAVEGDEVSMDDVLCIIDD